MLLETLDIKQNDIVIYSQNLFNNEKNFKIVHKDDAGKIAHSISYGEVCSCVNEYTPKNLIVYRLLTNIVGFEIYTAKFGYQININGSKELIFFDPVYAVRELEEYSKSIDYKQLRFRIQQIGLTTLNRHGDQANFAEIYSIDLEATEAKFQNDKVFADAIISTIKSSVQPKEISPAEDKTPVSKHSEEIKKIFEGNKPKNQPEKVSKIEPGALPVPGKTEEKQVKRKSEEELKFDELWKNKNSNNYKEHSLIKITEEQDAFNIKVSAVYKDEDQVINTEETSGLKKPKSASEEQNIKGIKIVQHKISEDKNFNFKDLMNINTSKNTAGFDDKKLSMLHAQFKPALKKQPEKEVKAQESNQEKTEKKVQSAFGKFLKNVQTGKDDSKSSRRHGEEKVSQVLDMFKTSVNANEYVTDRSNKQIVLKLDKK